MFNSLIYGLEYGRLKVHVAELSMDLTVDLREDVRVDYITFLSEEMVLACHLRQPLELT